MDPISDPSVIDASLDSRAVTFENPEGERGAGGRAHGGRKGAPSRRVQPGETVELCRLGGPGHIRHVWMTVPPMPPEQMRALVLEVFYDSAEEPSMSVPFVDFFGLAHGRPVPYSSAVHAVNEGRGFNSWLPMPFGLLVTMTFRNGSDRPVELYYQLDVTLEQGGDSGMGSYLHAAFNRQNPTAIGEDFVICSGLEGPGRFAGCAVGVRVLDAGQWYGEGEVKMYLDGDEEWPTICGTGLEDFVGSAWGMGAHHAPYGGAPLVVGPPGAPDFVGFYRWHFLDPVSSARPCGSRSSRSGSRSSPTPSRSTRTPATHPAAGAGWRFDPAPGLHAMGIAERVDDYCATAFVYCRRPQAVPPCVGRRGRGRRRAPGLRDARSDGEVPQPVRNRPIAAKFSVIMVNTASTKVRSWPCKAALSFVSNRSVVRIASCSRSDLTSCRSCSNSCLSPSKSCLSASKSCLVAACRCTKSCLVAACRCTKSCFVAACRCTKSCFVATSPHPTGGSIAIMVSAVTPWQTARTLRR